MGFYAKAIVDVVIGFVSAGSQGPTTITGSRAGIDPPKRTKGDDTMSDKKNDVVAAMEVLHTTDDHLVREGFKPLTIIAAHIDAAIAAAYGMPGWTPDNAKEFLGSRLERSVATWDKAFPTEPGEPTPPQIKIERELELRVFCDTINAILNSQGRPKMTVEEVRGWFDEFEHLRHNAASVEAIAKAHGLGQ
jgi:hypothetical protein